jgi:hypothetical protein
MDTQADRPNLKTVAAGITRDIAAEIGALPVRNTPSVRAVRRRYSRALAGADADLVLELARELRGTYGQHWIAYELIAAHPAAFRGLEAADLEELGEGIDSWSRVDSFARTLSGPAWRDGLVADALIHRWARSEDRWWRRAALVSTVAFTCARMAARATWPAPWRCVACWPKIPTTWSSRPCPGRCASWWCTIPRRCGPFWTSTTTSWPPGSSAKCATS